MIISITLNRDAIPEWIASVGFLTRANRVVTNHTTLSVVTANSWARIFTLLIDTSQVGRAVAVAYTFRPAVGHCSDHTVLTSAQRSVVDALTFRVGSYKQKDLKIFSFRIDLKSIYHKAKERKDFVVRTLQAPGDEQGTVGIEQMDRQ